MTATDEAQKPETPKDKVPLSITTIREIKEWVEEQANEDDRSVSIWLTRLLRKAMNQEQSG